MATAKKKPVTKAPAKKAPAKKAPAKKAAAPAVSAKGFDGERLVALLGATVTDPRVIEILRELGYTKSLEDAFDVELKKLGIALTFDDDVLNQVRFELRRKWTGHAKYEGRLPFDLSPDLLFADRATVLASRAEGAPMNDTWYAYQFPAYELSMGFGKTYVETVFVERKK